MVGVVIGQPIPESLQGQDPLAMSWVVMGSSSSMVMNPANTSYEL